MMQLAMTPGSHPSSIPPPIRRKKQKIEQVPNAVQPKKALSMDAFAPPKAKPKKTFQTNKGTRDRVLKEAAEFRAKNDWSKAKPSHFVALYSDCHDKVYGFRPIELETGKDFALATLAASRLLQTHFKNNREVMLEFIRWTWQREEGRERWRRQNSTSGQRLGWRLQFHVSLISDFRIDYERRNVKK